MLATPVSIVLRVYIAHVKRCATASPHVRRAITYVLRLFHQVNGSAVMQCLEYLPNSHEPHRVEGLYFMAPFPL